MLKISILRSAVQLDVNTVMAEQTATFSYDTGFFKTGVCNY